MSCCIRPLQVALFNDEMWIPFKIAHSELFNALTDGNGVSAYRYKAGKLEIRVYLTRKVNNVVTNFGTGDYLLQSTIDNVANIYSTGSSIGTSGGQLAITFGSSNLYRIKTDALNTSSISGFVDVPVRFT